MVSQGELRRHPRRTVFNGVRLGVLLHLGLLFATFLLHPGILQAETDTGSAHNLLLKYPLEGDWYLSSRNLLTSRDGFDDFFFGYLDLNLGRDLGEGWAAEAGYRHAWLDMGDYWRDEYRPSALLSYRGKLGDWSFANRHRLEYRMFEGGAGERFRYRNETRLIAPFEVEAFKAKPFFEEEFFYEFDGNGFNFNWLTGGLRWKVRDGVFTKLGYRWQAAKYGDDWSHRHQLVTGLMLFF
jgi:hypothetical protein